MEAGSLICYVYEDVFEKSQRNLRGIRTKEVNVRDYSATIQSARRWLIENKSADDRQDGVPEKRLRTGIEMKG